ncbi:MAG: 4-hydroxythreonine-4-phosphate dehydrogenase PdxA [Bacteroidales bacterium]|nr:4-hydroxythreonine-4-phosphate dehydrogenase PdxA [Bacteroidales bacterium]MBD5273925.1 4-hydroxythreonine-4-phosphate dehydrogenase PdxA [Bacteroides sp.]
MAKNIRVGITHGDFNGVGYEIIVKALADEKIPELFTPVVFGVQSLFEKARKEYGQEMPGVEYIKNLSQVKDGKINFLDLRLGDLPLRAGEPTKESGEAAVAALEAAVEAIREGDIDVMVTAPINKAAVQSETFHFPGHTEYLEAKSNPEPSEEGADEAPTFKAQMILFDDYLRVALVTTHLPVAEISSAITKEKVFDSIQRLDKVLRSDFGCERPKIAVLSLNPHCGDNGLLGDEEHTQIIPAIDEASDKGILAFGPYAADGFFATHAYRNFDGILAMYHDQGLAPFKALAGEHGVNFTAGLPFVRTSPDHGTAYDIAWKGEADPTSMREAIYKAIDIYRNRDRYRRASANPLRKARMEKGGQDKTVDLTKDTL